VSPAGAGPASLLRDRLALLILGVGLAVRLVAAALVPPGTDEAYYGVYAFHLAWGYFDHPPAVAVMAGLGNWLTGERGSLALRLGPILAFLLTAGLIYRLAAEIYGQRAGRIALLLLHTTPYFLAGLGAFVIPDNTLSLGWAALMYGMWRTHRDGEPRWLLLVGAALGLALLSKYHAVFLIAGLGWCLLFFREWRRYWVSPWLYAGAAVALAVFAPNVAWNAQNHWVSYVYQFAKGGSGGEPSLTLLGQAVAVQAGYLLPWTMVVLLGAAIWAWRQRQRTTRWILPFVLFPVVAFTVIGISRPILPHWPMPGYLSAMALAGGWLSHWRPGRVALLMWASAGVTGAAVAVLATQALTGFLSVPGEEDLTLKGQGWRQVVQRLEAREVYRPGEDFLFTNHWIEGGQLAYAAGPEDTVTVLNRDNPHGFAFWVNPRDLVGRDGILVVRATSGVTPGRRYGPFFEACGEAMEIATDRPFGPGNTFRVWRCESMVRTFPVPYGPWAESAAGTTQ